MAATGVRITPQAVFGLLILCAGVLLTLDNLNWVETDRILRFWPIGIIIAGAVKTLQSAETSGKVFGGAIMAVGVVWTAEHTLGLAVSLDDLWPIGLIALGIVIITRARRAPASPLDERVSLPDGAALGGDATVSEFAIWAGKQRRNASPAFRHADLTAIMGGVELDLRGAATATGEAVVDVFVMWGGVEIWVPPDWAVSNQVAIIMAGAEDHSTGTQDARHRLIVRGFVLMGGLEIKI
jgi:predicted membrane protein